MILVARLLCQCLHPRRANIVDSLFILIPIALVLVAIAVRVFLWAVKSGQFEDLDTEGKRILFDREPFDDDSEDNKYVEDISQK